MTRFRTNKNKQKYPITPKKSKAGYNPPDVKRPRKTLEEKILSAYDKGYDVGTIGKKVGASPAYVWEVVSIRNNPYPYGSSPPPEERPRSGISEHLIDDYAEDVSSRLQAGRYKEGARLAVNFRKASNHEDYNLMLKKAKDKGASDYDLRKMYKAIAEMPKKSKEL